MKYLDVDGVGRVSRIGLGTWQFGSREWGYGDSYASGAARDIVRRARALGVTFFDTAEVYGLAAANEFSATRLATSVPTSRLPARSSRSPLSPSWSNSASAPALGASSSTGFRCTRFTNPTRWFPTR